MLKQRRLSYDVIRIVAIMMVLMVHVSASVLSSYRSGDGTLNYIVGAVFNSLSRAGTPMFLMLSGALLLDEKRKFSAREFYRKNLLTICLLLLFWLLFYASWRSALLPMIKGKSIDPQDFLDYTLWLTGRYPHLWYLFMLVGAYLAIPVLRLFVKRENKNYILGLILLSVAAQFLPQTAGILTLDMEHTVADFVGKFHLEYATGYLPYLLMGWYLTAFPPKKKTRFLLGAAGLAGVGTIIAVVLLKAQEVSNVWNYVSEMNTLTAMLYGVGLFTLLTACFGERETKRKSVAFLSRMSFGIYIIHVLVLDVLVGVALPCKSFGERNPALYIMIIFALDFGISLLITFVMSRVKGVRKLVRG